MTQSIGVSACLFWMSKYNTCSFVFFTKYSKKCNTLYCSSFQQKNKTVWQILVSSIKTFKYKTVSRGSSGDEMHWAWELQLFRSEQLLCRSPEDHPGSETNGKAEKLINRKEDNYKHDTSSSTWRQLGNACFILRCPCYTFHVLTIIITINYA